MISVSVHGQAQSPTSVITGVVQGASGPEAGVWVIAETKELPTNFIKIVVTNDQGRFLLPDLPNANYSVWVRGYGLVDSKPQTLGRGDAKSRCAPSRPKTPQEAAKIYPGNYWLSMLEPPAPSMFPALVRKGMGSVWRCSRRATGSTRSSPIATSAISLETSSHARSITCSKRSRS